MKAINIFLIFSFFSLCLIACSDDDDNPGIGEESTELPVQGAYSWAFEIPGAGNQVSKHVFNDDVIAYEMTGDVYNVAYTMEVISYDNALRKIIALGEEGSAKDGVYFAIFLKNITENSVTMYKAELESEEVAANLGVPADDDTDFHGWNTYEKE